jgi:arginine/lysine/ornithine decarboxylase
VTRGGQPHLRRDDLPLPPGIPIIAPGEPLTEIVDYLERLAAAGVMVEAASDESLSQFRIVAEK